MNRNASETTNVSTSRIINCDGTKQILSNCSFIKCSSTRNDVVDNYNVQISCEARDSWHDFYGVKVNQSFLVNVSTDLVFLDSDFPQDFILHSLTSDMGLKNVTSLKLINTRTLVEFSNNFFRYLKIQDIEIHGHGATYLPIKIFFKMEALEKLKITKCTLSSMNFSKFNNLKKLSLSNNGIQMLKLNVFDNLVRLQVLDISSNNLTHLPSGRILKNLQQL